MLCQGSLKLYPVNLCAVLVFSVEMNIVTLITIYDKLKHLDLNYLDVSYYH